MIDTDDCPAPLVRYWVSQGKEVLAVLLVAAWIWTTCGNPRDMTSQPAATAPEASTQTHGTAREGKLVADQSNHHSADADARGTTVPLAPTGIEACPTVMVAAGTSKPEPAFAEDTAATAATAASPISDSEVRTVAFHKAFQPTLAQRAMTLLGSGMLRFWEGRYRLAIENFRGAHQCNPGDAAPLYFLALSHRRLGETTLAQQALTSAVCAEARQPIPNYGQCMERVQGPDRYWIEGARIKWQNLP